MFVRFKAPYDTANNVSENGFALLNALPHIYPRNGEYRQECKACVEPPRAVSLQTALNLQQYVAVDANIEQHSTHDGHHQRP